MGSSSREAGHYTLEVKPMGRIEESIDPGHGRRKGCRRRGTAGSSWRKLGFGLAVLAVSGCAVPRSEDRDVALSGPATVTIELAGTNSVPGALSIRVESIVFMPAAQESGPGGDLSPDRAPGSRPRSPAFLLALSPEPFLLDHDGAVLAEEVRIASGRYRELRLRLGEGSTFTSGERQIPISGGGTVPLDLDLASGDQVTLAIRLDGDRSFNLTSGGTVEFHPVLVSSSIQSGAAHAHGRIRGRVVPADAGAMIAVYGSGAPDSRSFTFADPRSGDFALEELPVGDYRVEVNPLEAAAFESRVLSGVAVPWDGLLDLGAIDLRSSPDAGKPAPSAFPALPPVTGEVDSSSPSP